MTFRVGEIQEVVQDQEDTIYTRFMLGHDEVAPDSATVKIYQPGAVDSELVSATADVGSSSLVSYTRTWSKSTFDLWEGWRADWSITKDGVVYTQRTWFDVALQKFEVGLVDEDLTGYDQACKTKQLASGGSLSTFRYDAMRELRNRIRAEIQMSPGYITTPELFFHAARCIALSKFFMAIFKMEGDSFHAKWKHYAEAADNEYRVAMAYLSVDREKEKKMGAPRRQRFRSAGR